MEAWRGFKKGTWCNNIAVSEFIRLNYTPYEGGPEFLEPATERTKNLFATVQELFRKEQEKIRRYLKCTNSVQCVLTQKANVIVYFLKMKRMDLFSK